MMTCQQIAGSKKKEDENPIALDRWAFLMKGVFQYDMCCFVLSLSRSNNITHSTRRSNTPINFCRGRFSWRGTTAMLGGENILDLILANFPCLPGLASSSTPAHATPLPAQGVGRQLHLKGWQIIMTRIVETIYTYPIIFRDFYISTGFLCSNRVTTSIWYMLVSLHFFHFPHLQRENIGGNRLSSSRVMPSNQHVIKQYCDEKNTQPLSTYDYHEKKMGPLVTCNGFPGHNEFFMAFQQRVQPAVTQPPALRGTNHTSPGRGTSDLW